MYKLPLRKERLAHPFENLPYQNKVQICAQYRTISYQESFGRKPKRNEDDA
jgi:hypothetical protein